MAVMAVFERYLLELYHFSPNHDDRRKGTVGFLVDGWLDGWMVDDANGINISLKMGGFIC